METSSQKNKAIMFGILAATMSIVAVFVMQSASATSKAFPLLPALILAWISDSTRALSSLKGVRSALDADS